MRAQDPPEVFDGGYWYRVPAVQIPPEEGGGVTVNVPGAGWCAWYQGDGTALVRTPLPVSNIDVVGSASGLDKPRGRIGGG